MEDKRYQLPAGIIDAVLDTDTYNEIDDQFALSLMIKSPERINLVGVYAAPFHNGRSTGPEDGMLKSYEEIKTLLKLTGREDLLPRAFEGSRSYLPSETEYVDSSAARDLVELAGNYSPEHPLYVVAIGAITNVASALIMKPEIAKNLVIVWLGGHALEWPDTEEFNMMQDVAAARVVYDSEAAYVQLPCMGVVDHFTVSEPELRYWFLGKNALCDHLAGAVIEEANSYANGKPWTRVIWDVTAAAWLLNDNNRFMSGRVIPRPIPEYDHHYSHDFRRAPMLYIWHINRDALMEELIGKLTR